MKQHDHYDLLPIQGQVFLSINFKLFFGVSAPHNLPASIGAEAGPHVPGFKLFAALLALQRLLCPG
jgi:hypothetical protein